MAKNVWNATLEPNNNVKQNTFDWTHVNNLTTQIGRITPIQCELVPAKTSFRVKPFPALQLMPMVFPIQTRMRATISYFRYPLRALWKDYKDFEGNFREGLEEPYHDFNSSTLVDKMLGTGKLMDYLGVPTTMVGTFGSPATGTLETFVRANPQSFFSTSVPPLPNNNQVYNYMITNKPDYHTLYGESLAVGDPDSWLFSYVGGLEVEGKTSKRFVFDIVCTRSNDLVQDINRYFMFAVFAGSNFVDMVLSSNYTVTPSTPGHARVVVNCPVVDDDITDLGIFIENGVGQSPFFEGSNPTFTIGEVALYASSNSENVVGITSTTSPYYNSNSVNKDKQIKLSAYAARAYEGIYNSVYRDNRNNPYYIDGIVQYNQWIPSYEGGADSYPYELRYANWEKDFLTTAVQSPQQGNAPLVGITTYEQSSVVTDESGEPATVKQTKVAMVDEEGKRYSLEFESDSDELKNVKYVELDNGTAVRSARSLFDLVTSGISITDLRNVNAYQKFLELNMRKGYSYKEIIEGRFDVKVRYADLLLPEFFGGFSRDINMNAITQTVDKDDANRGKYKDVLGSQAGVGYFRGGTDANIECFCDEESIIMGLLVITPLPVYTQLLPKHFLYRGLLDHFNPEFNNISFQPITYKEVCPIQSYNENPDTLTKTFGYQRPWYEYCQRYDQAHGLFRTDLSNFLMHRVFDQKPELAQSFLIIDPEQVTDVFSVTQTTDKVYGQILLDCTVKLPVARVAIPRLD